VDGWSRMSQLLGLYGSSCHQQWLEHTQIQIPADQGNEVGHEFLPCSATMTHSCFPCALTLKLVCDLFPCARCEPGDADQALAPTHQLGAEGHEGG
jgi:hypothetical protein